jgi:hypothetical protein
MNRGKAMRFYFCDKIIDKQKETEAKPGVHEVLFEECL